MTATPSGKLLTKGIGVAVVILIALYTITLILRARGASRARATVEAVYKLLETGDYPALARDHLATASAIRTFQEADRVHGRLAEWHELSSDTHLLGRPTQCEVMVTRNGKSFVDVLALGDSIHLHIVLELEEADWRAGRYDRAVRVIAKPSDPKRP